jgi:hypothetical protein
MEICAKLLTLNRRRMIPSNGAPAPLLHDHAALSTMARRVKQPADLLEVKPTKVAA